ncbi:hypothetical protein TRIHO_31120 [Tritonibacter horizontis]|uniref:DNA repair protein MmcB-related protein n=1 Tax=Tritonibacter horizontis TaxID=1768241 RepID=A0A132BUQ8_9RHOB|nr:hypothetical protein TRIHO_31120 [Tritonibacter horizontis]
MIQFDPEKNEFADECDPDASLRADGSGPVLQPGQRLARGVARYLRSIGFASVEEFVPDRGLRVDVMALGPKGELWVIECKSSRADFQSDGKWHHYLGWCDRYFWAVDMAFPTELLPEETGLILADAYDAEVVRMAPEDKLPPARRKKLIQKFAMDAARRLQQMRDPRPGRDGLLFDGGAAQTQVQTGSD